MFSLPTPERPLGLLAHTAPGVWKVPTGLLDLGEDNGAGTEREVHLLFHCFPPPVPPSSSLSSLPTFDPPLSSKNQPFCGVNLNLSGVKEETGVSARFKHLIAFRHAHAFAIGKCDLFFLTRLEVILSKNGSQFLDKEEDFYTIRKALKDADYPCFKYDLTTTASGWKEEVSEGMKEGV
ncbi:hypothetical protein NSK_003404 [Nannochloropsis salina CCMP1776]|uniref:Uncharacterized protein n=1 Tax=Nannochloropsis salina CCMP1776 TaxID=1027361 RepID=A0A4D9D8P7_9STRA|nr:hypothetical protein NSK_003404 [Nannochloropsis salina CCMP1776]|eukprot:TFJ84979.1 hypothetical protein NSK_003404 [Nannochloropsis salina CCMP1776]